MNNLGTTSSGRLNDYSRLYTPQSLLLRYAKGRNRHFLKRQIFSVGTGALLWFLISPRVGLLAMTLVFLGDVADCFFLRFVPRLLESGYSLRRLQIFSGATAMLQATTASICVWLSWHAQHENAEPLFALGLLISFSINGGLVLPYNRVAGAARLIVYGCTPLVIILFELWEPFSDENHIHINLAGLVMLYLMMVWLQSFMVGNFHRTRLHMKYQFEQRQQLEVSNALLQEQQEEARRLALVAQHANDSVFLIDKNGKISWANDSFTRITGYTFFEAIGQKPFDLLSSDQGGSEAVKALLENRKNGLPFQGEIQSRRKDGTLIWIETNQVPILSYDGKVETVVAVERDVTAAHLHAQEMKEARVAAEEGERSKSEFLATMSHEIRTPMNGVIGMAQMLEGTDQDPDQRLYTDTILSSARTLLALINDVLDVSKLDAQKMSFSHVDFDIRVCFQETLRLLETQAQEKGLTLALDVPESAPQYVHGDDRRIRQILLNLVGNAIKFTDVGEVRVAIDIQPQGDALTLNFSVEDTGIGIPPNKMERVFEHFSQADAATTRRFGGTGLGLTISRKLARAMGGEITAVSEVGLGTCLRVTLQLAAGKSPATMDTDTIAIGTGLGSIQSGMRILVAEDNKVNRLVMQKFLRDVPIELEFAHNGSEAVDMVHSMKPDLVFMDMSMPVMNGIDATRTIRSNAAEQPVIVALTANAFDSDRDACLQAGMDEFLSKPLNRKDVLAMLQRYSVGT